MTVLLNGQLDAVKQRRLLNRLVRDLVAFTGTAITDIAAKPKAPRRQKNRLTYRKNLTDGELDALVAQIGLGRWWSAFERATRPANGNGEPLPARCLSTADMFAACPTCSE